MESSLIGIQHIDGRVEYITVLFGVSDATLCTHLTTRVKVLELIKSGSRDSIEEIEELDIIPDDCFAAEVVDDYKLFLKIKNHKHYLFTADNTWTLNGIRLYCPSFPNTVEPTL